jgi:hypothetical protein
MPLLIKTYRVGSVRDRDPKTGRSGMKILASGFVNAPDADPRLSEEWQGASWTTLEGGWIGLQLGAFPGHRIEFLPDFTDPQRPQIVGVRVEPLDVSVPVPLTQKQLKALPLHEVATTVFGGSLEQSVRAGIQLQKLRKQHPRKPYGREHPRGVAEIVARATSRGGKPHLAIMKEFGVSRATAYQWVKDVCDTKRDTTAPKHSNT